MVCLVRYMDKLKEASRCPHLKLSQKFTNNVYSEFSGLFD